MKRATREIAIVAVLVATGCGDDNGGGDTLCEPGSLQDCVCGGGGNGRQICLDGGSDFGLTLRHTHGPRATMATKAGTSAKSWLTWQRLTVIMRS